MSIREFLFAKRTHLMSLVFFVGFITDNIMLSRIDVLWSSLVLLAYLTIALMTVFFSALSRSRLVSGSLSERIVSWSPFVAQFAFGSLFSGYFVFYTRSASFTSSWLFVVLLGALFLGNEFFKNYYRRLEFQINILFVAIFFFATLYMPIVLGQMDAWVFLASGGVSLVGIILFMSFLSRIVPEVIRGMKVALRVSLGSVFVVINILYFANIIPPIPLVLKEAGIYHLVLRTARGMYQAQTEHAPWYNLGARYHPIVHRTPGESLYFFSAVFAPARLSVPIFHEWQYFDSSKNEWVTTDRLQFQIVGGRDGGYRGYSVKGSVFAGEWRVRVVTERGQSLGQTKFTVVDVSTPPVLVTNPRN